MLMHLDPLHPDSQYNFAISEIQDAAAAILKIQKIAATERPILTKFGTVIKFYAFRYSTW